MHLVLSVLALEYDGLLSCPLKQYQYVQNLTGNLISALLSLISVAFLLFTSDFWFFCALILKFSLWHLMWSLTFSHCPAPFILIFVLIQSFRTITLYSKSQFRIIILFFKVLTLPLSCFFPFDILHLLELFLNILFFSFFEHWIYWTGVSFFSFKHVILFSLKIIRNYSFL